MKRRTYDEKLANIKAFVEITNYHWERLEGELFNDPEFWEHTMGTMTDQDWWDWVDIEPALRIQHPDSFHKYPYVDAGTRHINESLMKGKPLYKKDVKNANFQTFRAWMNIKDVVNDFNKTPTKQFEKPKTKPLTDETPKGKTKPNPSKSFWNLFEEAK